MRGLKRTAAGLAAIALSAGVLAGCGSTSSDAGAAESVASNAETVASAVESTATTAAALTKDEYVAEANAICAKLDDTANSIDDADERANVKARVQKAVASAKEGVAELKALVPPADLATAHAALVQTSGQSIALFESISAGAQSGDLDDATLTADAKKAAALANKQLAAAKQLGLTNCFTGEADTADDAND